MPIPIVLHGGLGFLIDGSSLRACRSRKPDGGARSSSSSSGVSAAPFPAAALLAATLLVTGTGATAATWIRHDTLPVVLRRRARRAVDEPKHAALPPPRSARSPSPRSVGDLGSTRDRSLAARSGAIAAGHLRDSVPRRRGRAARCVRGDDPRPADGQCPRARLRGVARVDSFEREQGRVRFIFGEVQSACSSCWGCSSSQPRCGAGLAVQEVCLRIAHRPPRP
jgi:hypothetical protein